MAIRLTSAEVKDILSNEFNIILWDIIQKKTSEFKKIAWVNLKLPKLLWRVKVSCPEKTKMLLSYEMLH